VIEPGRNYAKPQDHGTWWRKIYDYPSLASTTGLGDIYILQMNLRKCEENVDGDMKTVMSSNSVKKTSNVQQITRQKSLVVECRA
jgi:hypothetical protein